MPRKGDRPNRVRAFRPKVHTGCITCKVRRIKCDEAWPSCLRCVNTGRKCDGYQVPGTSRDHSPQSGCQTPPKSSSLVKTVRPLNLSLMNDSFGTDSERQSFNFFCANTAPQLSGLFESTFWNRLVLQASFHEPAIRHAAIALGALHEKTLRFGPSGDETSQGAFALQEYVKSINLLVEPLSQNKPQALDVTLMTCILFTSFDTMRGHYGSALSHINGGVKILSEVQHNTSDPLKNGIVQSETPYVSIDELTALLTRLDTQATQINSRRKTNLRLLEDYGADFGSKVPRFFKSLTEARISLDYLWNCSTNLSWLLTTGNLDVLSRKSIIEKVSAVNKLLPHWTTSFDNFVASNKDHFNSKARQSIGTLRVQQNLLEIMLNEEQFSTPNNEPVWEDFMPQMERVVSLAESVVSESATTGDLNPTFSLDVGIVVPLFVVASKCRNKTLRRKAIELLACQQRQEGLWDSQLVARVLAHVVAIEELGFENIRGEDIPDWARVFEIDAAFDIEGRRARVTYWRLKDQTPESKKYITEELLTW